MSTLFTASNINVVPFSFWVILICHYGLWLKKKVSPLRHQVHDRLWHDRNKIPSHSLIFGPGDATKKNGIQMGKAYMWRKFCHPNMTKGKPWHKHNDEVNIVHYYEELRWQNENSIELANCSIINKTEYCFRV